VAASTDRGGLLYLKGERNKMLKEILKIQNGKLIMDYEIHQCDCCGAEIEEAHSFYYE